MPNSYVRMRKGEKLPVYGYETLSSGTLTIQSGATATLYDANGAVVSGFNGVAVTGYDASALATVRAWLLLDTSVAAITPGFYTLVFSFQALGSDTITRTFAPSVEVQVLALTA